jgi:hypothetical protein
VTTVVRLEDLWQDGPPIRLTTLARLSGQSVDTLRRESEGGYLRVVKKPHRRTSPCLVTRVEARRWLAQIGIAPTAAF